MSKFINQLNDLKHRKQKALAILIDPDLPLRQIAAISALCRQHRVDFIFAGGSLVTNGVMAEAISTIQSNCNTPVYIFPGNEMMIDEQADGILFLSLLSGRNPEYLIGKHIVAAPQLAASALDVVPTAYLLIDGGRETSVSYISNTKPIPSDKPDIAMATALAGKLMGMDCVYMDAGSGAINAIPEKMIATVSDKVSLPLIVGGGIRNAETAAQLYTAGADLLVIGNGVEENDELIKQISAVKQAVTNAVTL